MVTITNFYNAFFKLDARGPTTSNNPGDKYTTITDCDCTRPSREDSVDRYTFIRSNLNYFFIRIYFAIN